MMEQSREERLGFSIDDLNELFEYKDGLLSKRVLNMNTIKGQTAWPKDKSGYMCLKSRGVTLYVHRIIWIMHNGYIPVGMIVDHIDRVRDSNDISNLRLATPMGNSANRGNNTSGVVGVSWNRVKNRWNARMSVDGVMKSFGNFVDIQDAIAARRNAEIRLGCN